MTLAEKILLRLATLSESEQSQVLTFVEFLEACHPEQPPRQEMDAWSTFSLDTAMQGLEDDPVEYTVADLKETLP